MRIRSSLLTFGQFRAIGNDSDYYVGNALMVAGLGDVGDVGDVGVMVANGSHWAWGRWGRFDYSSSLYVQGEAKTIGRLKNVRNAGFGLLSLEDINGPSLYVEIW